MLKKLGLKTLALAAGLAVAAPTISLARDRDDYRGGDFNRNQRFDSHARYEHRDWDDRGVRFQTNGRRSSFGVGINTAPAYRNGYSNGYYNGYSNGYGNSQVNGYYDNQGCFHAY
jgi:hypothetical protein